MYSINSLAILLTFAALIQSRQIHRTSQKLLKDPSISEIQGDSRINFLTGENLGGGGGILGLNSLSLGYPQRELIDLGVPSHQQQQLGGISQDKPCATVLTTSNCVIQVPEDAQHKNIAERQFTLAFGLIKEQCSLTIRDCSGSYFTASNFLHGSICSTAVSVCCECNGCTRPSNEMISDDISESGTCAVMFEHERCSLCHGFRLQVGRGDNTMKMNDLVDNKVSSIYVMEDCELIIYQDSNFQGFAALAQGSLDYLPPEWNDVISSFQCSCNTEGRPSPPTPAPQPPTTLIPIEIMTTMKQGSSSTMGNSEEVPTTIMATMTTDKIQGTTSAPPETSTAAFTTTTPPPEITTTTSEPTTSTTEEIYVPIY